MGINRFILFWNDAVDTFQTYTAVLIIGGGIVAIFCILLFSIIKLRKINAMLAITMSTLLCCFLMVPIISSFNYYVDKKVGGSIIDEAKAEVRAARAEAERIRAQQTIRELERDRIENQITIGKQTLEIEALNDNILLLRNASISMQSFSQILEIALLKTELNQTRVWKNYLGAFENGWGLRANYYNDEALIINTYNIIAKFGVDFNEIKVVRLDDNIIAVSGIRPTFIGTERNIKDTIVKEIRRVNFKRGVLDSVDTRYDSTNRGLADQREQQYDREFQQQLSRGLELGFMNDAVVQLAQNFITVILAPLYRTIRFTDTVLPNALPIMNFIQNELEEREGRKIRLLEINENLLFANESMADEVATIESTYDLESLPDLLADPDMEESD